MEIEAGNSLDEQLDGLIMSNYPSGLIRQIEIIYKSYHKSVLS